MIIRQYLAILSMVWGMLFGVAYANKPIQVTKANIQPHRTLPPNSAYNGTVFIYKADSKKNLFYDQKRVLFIANPNKKANKKERFIAFVPIGYYETGEKILSNNGKKPYKIEILEREYKKEQIKVPQDKITYTKQISQRIERERDDMLAVYEKKTANRLGDKPFIAPLDCYY